MIRAGRLARAAWLAVALLALGCRSKNDVAERDGTRGASSATGSPSASPSAHESAPRLLYLPDGGDFVQNQGQLQPAPQLLPNMPPVVSSGCPPEMVSIRGQFCIDRFEASLVDAKERQLSPFYPPSHDELVHVFGVFRSVAVRGGRRAPDLPQPPEFALSDAFEPRARSRPSVVPNGYMSGVMARRACENSGKRLCTQSEWTMACKGERATKFPYGDSYREGVCNVFRASHPAMLLYGDPSKNHLDPRLNLTEDAEGPLLRKTGATEACASSWGQDAVYDMVGNLDEWVDDAAGAFQGGFFSRSTREGCDARITVHPTQYFDYSLGVRCCK